MNLKKIKSILQHIHRTCYHPDDILFTYAIPDPIILSRDEVRSGYILVSTIFNILGITRGQLKSEAQKRNSGKLYINPTQLKQLYSMWLLRNKNIKYIKVFVEHGWNYEFNKSYTICDHCVITK